MKAELIPLGGGDPIPVTKDVTVVGRREFCDIQVDHPSLSKRHCILVKTDGLLVIRDLATTNGTKVKGQAIRWAALLPEDRIALGSVKFQIYLGPDDIPSPSELPARRAAPVPRGVAQAAGSRSSPSRGLSTAAPAPPPRKPQPAIDLPPINLGDDWLDAARGGIAEDRSDDDLIIDLD